MTDGVILILLSAVLIAVAWVTVAAGTAIEGLSRARINEMAESAPRKAKRLAVLIEDPPRFINALLLLRSIASFAAFGLMLSAFLTFVDWNYGWTVLLVVAIMSLISYVVLGVSARTTGLQRSYSVAAHTSMFTRTVAVFLHPITSLLIHVGNGITPGPGYRTGPFASAAEFAELLDAPGAQDALEDDERAMIRSVFALGGTIVREVMVPRTEVVFIEEDKTLRQALSLGLRSGFSRIPVVKDSPDEVLGVVMVKDLVRWVFEKRSNEKSTLVTEIMRPVRFVPDSKPADDLLREMQSEREHLAVVVDEFGGTAGIVTIEDILEEIVGEIEDEYDTSSPEVSTLGDGALRLSARMSIEHLMDVTGIDLDPDVEGVETLGGLLARRLGRVPIPGAQIQEQGWRFQAQAGSGRRNRVTAVVATLLEASDDGEE